MGRTIAMASSKYRKLYIQSLEERIMENKVYQDTLEWHYKKRVEANDDLLHFRSLAMSRLQLLEKIADYFEEIEPENNLNKYLRPYRTSNDPRKRFN